MNPQNSGNHHPQPEPNRFPRFPHRFPQIVRRFPPVPAPVPNLFHPGSLLLYKEGTGNRNGNHKP